jgi:hypothetical protein
LPTILVLMTGTFYSLGGFYHKLYIFTRYYVGMNNNRFIVDNSTDLKALLKAIFLIADKNYCSSLRIINKLTATLLRKTIEIKVACRTCHVRRMGAI